MPSEQEVPAANKVPAHTQDVFHWLFCPVHGARRFTVRGVEVMRAFLSSAAVFTLIDTLQYVARNMDVLNLSKEKAVLLARLLALAIFFLHLGAQAFQRDPATTPEPPPPPPPPYPYAYPDPRDYPQGEPPPRRNPYAGPPGGRYTTPPDAVRKECA